LLKDADTLKRLKNQVKNRKEQVKRMNTLIAEDKQNIMTLHSNCDQIRKTVQIKNAKLNQMKAQFEVD